MIKSFKKNAFIEFLFLGIVFFLFLLLLTPSGFGEIVTAETWKSWSASRILLLEGKFVQNSLGPLYYASLILLSPFNYKYSILIEYFVTHIFFFLCIYFIFKKYNQSRLGILFSLLIVSYIAFIQSPKYVLAPGFLILHYANHDKHYFNRWFPPFLLTSLLCNWGYIVFYIGHIIGKIFYHYKNKIFFICKPNILSIILCFVLICPFLFKADKFYNNHYVDFYNPEYAPISLDSPLKIGFFQIGNFKFSKNKYTDDNLYKADWFLTHKHYYGECKTLICVLKNKPKIIIEEILNDPGYNLRVLSSLIFNKEMLVIKKIFFIPFFLIFILIIILGLINIYQNNKTNYALIFSILLGSFGYLLALSLTTFSYRYSFPLFPILILLLLNSQFDILNFKKKYPNVNLILLLVIITQITFNIKDFSENYNNKEFYRINKINNTENVTNYFKSAEQVFDIINNKQKILTTDSNWLSGFSKVNPKNIYSLFALPPINNSKTEAFLSSLDVILLNYNTETPEPSIGTQSYLRYKLHLKEYLVKNKNKWQKEQIKNYGYIYSKKN